MSLLKHQNNGILHCLRSSKMIVNKKSH